MFQVWEMAALQQELAGEQECSASFQIVCVCASLDYLYFCTPVKGQSGDYS